MSLQKIQVFQSKSVPFQEANINLYSLLGGIWAAQCELVHPCMGSKRLETIHCDRSFLARWK